MAEEQRQQLHDAFHRSSIVVGCALLPKKVQRYLTQRMLQTAAEHKILLKQIDPSRPLGPQGPFHVIIHKLRPNPEWEQQLRQYVSDHPQVVVVDRLDKIRQLHNRATMLRPLQGDGITLQQPLQLAPAAPAAQATISPPAGGSAPQTAQQQQGQVVLVQAPLQVEIAEGTTEAEAQAALAAAGLVPPLLCKPLWTDGRDGSHKLAVLHDLEALGRLLRGAVCHEFKPPLVVQQFVEHGGVLFKVYVLGSQTYVTARPSLGETVLEPAHAVQQLPRISCVSVFSKQQQHQQHHTPPMQPSAEQQSQQAGGGTAGTMQLTPPPRAAAAQQPQQQQQQQQHRASQRHSAALAAVAAQSVWSPPSSIVAPPAWLTSALAATLRQELGMQLFNFDLIVPEQQPEQGQQQLLQQQEDPNAAPALCYVVDINFFPGVDKIPDFEQRFVDFLLAAATSAPEAADCGSHQQQQQQEAKADAAGRPGSSAVQAAAAGKAAADGGGELQDSSARFRRQSSSSSDAESSGSGSAGGRGSSSSGGSVGISTNSSGSLGRCLQHSLSSGFSAGAAGGGGQHNRRHRASSGSGGHSSGRDSPSVSPAQWGDLGVLGSSPPPQLQVAGCS